MSGILRLSLAHALHARLRSALIVVSIAVAAFIPVATSIIASSLESALLRRADSTSLVIGGLGGRIDLVLAALYFRPARIRPVTMGDWKRLDADFPGRLLPVNVQHTAGGVPVVATPLDYLETRHAALATGRLPTLVGQAVIGARAAARLGTVAGSFVHSDQVASLDIAAPASIRLRITGVFAATGTPDDDAIFTDLKTAWVLAGLAHGHADAATAIPSPLLLDRTGDRVVVSETLVEDNEITAANAASLHLHADETTLPLTAVLGLSLDDRERTLLRSRINAAGRLQAVEPGEVVREIMGHVARFTRAANVIALAVTALTGLLVGMILAMSAKARSRELLTLERLGASRGQVAMLLTVEAVALTAAGAVLAAVAGLALWLHPPDLVKLL
jgi:putative ABC transport system permease protein